VHPNFATRWQELLSQPQILSRFEQQVIKQWLSLIKETKLRWLMMSQYPSLVLETEMMRGLNQCAQHLLQKIKYQLQPQIINHLEIQELLNQNPNYNFDLIANEVLNAKNWLIYSSQI
jgi:tyrosine-protein phosphatase YwqE